MKCELAGYIALILWFFILGLMIWLVALDIHFEGDVLVILFLVATFERCRDTYVEYRNKTSKR